MKNNIHKKLTYEDKFDRKYACWTFNHNGWLKYKTTNRRLERRKLKKLLLTEKNIDNL